MAYLQGYGPEGNYLASRFDTQWAGRTEIAWGNKNFTKPSGKAWVRFTVRHSGADRMNPGPDPIRRHDGMVVLEVFAPEDQGEGPVDDLCDAAAAIYRDHTQQQGLRFRTPHVVNVGPEGSWYRKNVLIPFVRDTVFS